jgi:hypothetical protein
MQNGIFPNLNAPAFARHKFPKTRSPQRQQNAIPTGRSERFIHGCVNVQLRKSTDISSSTTTAALESWQITVLPANP